MRYFVAILLAWVTLVVVVQAEPPQSGTVREPHARSRAESACQEQAVQHSGIPKLFGELEVLCAGATSTSPATCAYEAAQRGVHGWDNIAILCQHAVDTAVDQPSICAQTGAQQGFQGWDNVAVLCHGATDTSAVQCAKSAVGVGVIGWYNVALMCRRAVPFTPPDNHTDPIECTNYLIKTSDFKTWFGVALLCAKQ